MSIGIGEALRAAREQAGIRLADAAAETRIRQSHLVALEEENFEPIGGHVYAKGFIRSYARHLGLDPDPLVRAYQDNFEQAEEEGWAGTAQPVETPPPPRRPITTIVVVLAVLTLGGLALLGILIPEDANDQRQADAPDPVAAETEEPDPATDEDNDGDGNDADEGDGGDDADGRGDDGDGDEGDEDEADEEDEGDEGDEGPDLTEEIVLTFSVIDGQSWARVVVDGVAVDEATFQSGHTETYTGEEIVVRVGDAGAVALEVNGEDLGEIGGRGDVVDVLCSTASGQCETG